MPPTAAEPIHQNAGRKVPNKHTEQSDGRFKDYKTQVSALNMAHISPIIIIMQIYMLAEKMSFSYFKFHITLQSNQNTWIYIRLHELLELDLRHVLEFLEGKVMRIKFLSIYTYSVRNNSISKFSLNWLKWWWVHEHNDVILCNSCFWFTMNFFADRFIRNSEIYLHT